MTRHQLLTALAHGLLVTSAVAPVGLVAWEQADFDSSAVFQMDATEPDTLFINGRAFVLE
ncbi:hypothetical protein [Microbacterium sp. VKM Ac-2923]|uniref:hypothetical protein n=1 Tax=Microbacterium sp. VKM Ac-2923 TaxID=2929476 RepID=UPI001FB395CA|nr:hypothetical protein [Microbacterium sp. VKM Ac-2923]MCJ1708879.1 hypothetical protein [Microbacterium sp. VKM Ac-2923]